MFEMLFGFVDKIAVSNANELSIKFMAAITPLMAALVALYAIYLAYQALYDTQNLMVMESLKFTASLGLVMSMALSSTWYLEHVVPVVSNSGDGIVGVLFPPDPGGNSTTSVKTVQLMSDKVGDQIKTLWGSIELDIFVGDTFTQAFQAIIMIIFLFLGSAPFFAIVVAYLVLAKMMVSLLLVIGPLFIMFAFFPATRELFKAWTGQVLNYLMLNLLFAIALNLFVKITDLTVLSPEGGFVDSFFGFVLFIIMSFVAVQIPALASSLTGGVGISGLVSQLGNAAKGSGLGTAAKGAAKGAAKLGAKGFNSLRGKGNQISPG